MRIQPEDRDHSIVLAFDHCIKTYVYYQSFFLSLLVIQLLFLLVFFSFLSKSALFAIGLALFFLTLFSFFLFKVYYQALKLDKFDVLINSWIEELKSHIIEKPILAQELIALSDELSGRETSYYAFSPRFKILQPFLHKISFCAHWEDLLYFRELLLKKAIKEYFKTLRVHPTDLEVHTHLANTYIKLGALYRYFLHKSNAIREFGFGKNKKLDVINFNFRRASKKAIEEMNILKELAPNVSDVEFQLALLYNDLKMIHEETQQYEIIIEKNPTHQEALFQLGSLYFQQGFHAKGLQVYQKLKDLQFENAEALLKHYGD